MSIQKYRQFIISSDIGTGKTITSFLPFFNYYCKGVNKKFFTFLIKVNKFNIRKSLSKISSELKIDCNIQKRTSDDSYLKKQLFKIPEILLTTPESFALMISNIDALNLLENLDFVIIDEITELINNKRGDQLALTLSKLISVNKKVTLIGLSATIKDPIILKNGYHLIMSQRK